MQELGDMRIRRAAPSIDAEQVVVMVPKFGKVGTRILEWIRVPTTTRLRLDRLGSEAWRLADGRTGSEILIGLQARFPDEDDLPERLGAFLGPLVARGLLEASPEA